MIELCLWSVRLSLGLQPQSIFLETSEKQKEKIHNCLINNLTIKSSLLWK